MALSYRYFGMLVMSAAWQASLSPDWKLEVILQNKLVQSPEMLKAAQ